MKEFKEGEIFRNTIVAHPRARFFCYNGSMYYADTTEETVKLNDFLFLEIPPSGSAVTEGLLLETGLFLLTEDGDYILLE